MKLSQLFPLALLAAVLATRPATAADSAAGVADDLANVLALFRSDLNQAKIQTLNETLRLTGPEAEKFWPIYRDYERDLARLGDERVALIRRFAREHADGTLSNEAARGIARDWLRLQRKRIDLWDKYHARLARAVSPVRAAQFLQVEHELALFVDLNIASAMPLMGGTDAAR